MENITDGIQSQRIYVSMAHMSSNAEITRINHEEISQLSNLVLNSDATCHMTPEISDFIPRWLVETYKYTKVTDRNFVTLKRTG